MYNNEEGLLFGGFAKNSENLTFKYNFLHHKWSSYSFDQMEILPNFGFSIDLIK